MLIRGEHGAACGMRRGGEGSDTIARGVQGHREREGGGEGGKG